MGGAFCGAVDDGCGVAVDDFAGGFPGDFAGVGLDGEDVGVGVLIGEMAASTAEQARGLAEVNTTMNQMDQVTQQNAAMVEEATAAASQLKGEAASLTRLASRCSSRATARSSRRAACSTASLSPAFCIAFGSSVGPSACIDRTGPPPSPPPAYPGAPTRS